MNRRQALLLPVAAACLRGAPKTPEGYSSLQGPAGHLVFRSLKSGGKPILILHELPGLSPKDLALGLRIASEGFTTYLPLIFGNPGEYSFYRNAIRACHGGQFNCSGSDKESPCVEWLRPLCDQISKLHNGEPLGVIGMCLTGSIPIALMSQTCVKAVVLSQPALPGVPKDAIGVTRKDIDFAKTRPDVPMLGFRFSTDTISPPERFAALRKEFPAQFRGIEIEPQPGEPQRASHAMHAVLTESFNPAIPALQNAYEEVIRLFRTNL